MLLLALQKRRPKQHTYYLTVHEDSAQPAEKKTAMAQLKASNVGQQNSICAGDILSVYSIYIYSVLPRPFLQGATPCPFLVTPCLFLKVEMTPCLFYKKKTFFFLGSKRLIMLVAFSSVCSFLLSTHSVDCSSFIVRSPH